jgi:hypothetical protein
MKKIVVKREPETFDGRFLDSLRHSKLVGIHGRKSSGKTELTKELVSLVGGTHIQVDDWLEQPPDGRTYLERVKAEALSKEIQKSVKPVFLDCFIVLDVLAKIKMQSDYLIYCDRLTDENWLHFKQDGQNISASYEERRNPRETANVIFTFNMWLEDV